tara:strand:- start:1209 stop:1898 length:690 start_codon:yes stop_codon:yes gene_type:complete
MQTSNARSDLIRNISIIEFLFIVVLLVLANFSRQLEETNKKERDIILLIEQNNKLEKERDKLREKNKELEAELEVYRQIKNDKLIIANENIELKKQLKELKKQVTELKEIEEKYNKLRGNDKPNCDIARKNNLTRILKITPRINKTFDIEKLWPDKLDSQFKKIPGLNELIGNGIPVKKVRQLGYKLSQWPEYNKCRFRMDKVLTESFKGLRLRETRKLTTIIDNIFYQ